MKINLTIDTEEQSINVLYNGYNIIRTTLYNAETTKELYEILRNTINNEEFTDIKTEEEFEEFLKLED